MRYMVYKLLLLGGLFLVNIAKAEVVQNLYSVDIPVSNQSQQVFLQVLPQALSQVLLKVSNHSDIMGLLTSEKKLPDIKQSVEQYHYFHRTDRQGEQQLVLHLNFSYPFVNQLIKSSGQVVLGANRPLILVWLTQQDSAGTSILSDDDNSLLTVALKKYAKQRALPIIFPNMDLTDQTSLTSQASDLSKNQYLMAISKRYGVDSVWVGYMVSAAGKNVQVKWYLLLNGNASHWNVAAADVNALMQQSINQLSNIMGSQLNLYENKMAKVYLCVVGIGKLSDYVNLLKHLEQLDLHGLIVKQINKDSVCLDVQIEGGQNHLTQILSTLQWLRPYTQSTSDSTLSYQWLSDTDLNKSNLQEKAP